MLDYIYHIDIKTVLKSYFLCETVRVFATYVTLKMSSHNISILMHGIIISLPDVMSYDKCML